MTKNDRLNELIEAVKLADENKVSILLPSLEDMVFLENQIKELKEKPFIVYNPKNPAQSKSTATGLLYVKLKQSYNNILKTVLMALRGATGQIDDGLDAFLEAYKDL